MRIYSNTLTPSDLRNTARQVHGLYIDDIKPIFKPRVRQKGYIVYTSGNTNRYRNSGTYGAEKNVNAATWDQHGAWFNLLYALDPNARVTFYDNAQDFHKRTNGKYRTTPEPQTLATHGVYRDNA